VTAHGVDLHAIDLDVLSQESTDALKTMVSENRRINVVVHNVRHMVLTAEAFTPDQLAQHYDTNVLNTQRVNRATLSHFRAQGKGLVVWFSSSSKRGGTPPYLTPYFAAKARMDALAVSYASELACWGSRHPLSLRALSPQELITSRTPAAQTTRLKLPNTTPEHIRDLMIRSKRALPPLCRWTQMSLPSPNPSSRSSTCHLGNDPSAHT
jgi:NAD(P)-dependent dehydrogenase (short-subunit alcohol dehydrogenase family)